MRKKPCNQREKTASLAEQVLRLTSDGLLYPAESGRRFLPNMLIARGADISSSFVWRTIIS
jgi:hypothetical protein